MIRLAVIGAGNHSAGNHGPGLRACKAAHPREVELAAVCDLDAKKATAFAEQFGFQKVYVEIDRMLAEERLDGLVAITPLTLTERMAGELLERRIPMVIEKPPGETSAATRRLLRIAERTGTPHMVSFNRRFIPAVTVAREWLDGPGKERPARLTIARMLRRARREAGFVVGTGIHVIDTVLSLMGRPETAFTMKVPSGVPDRYFYDASLQFRGGGIASVVLSPEAGVDEETFEIHGQGYCIQIDSEGCRVRIVDRGKECLSWGAAPDSEPAYRSGAFDETEAFFRCIRDGKGLAPGLTEGLISMIVSEAVEAGGEVRLDLP